MREGYSEQARLLETGDWGRAQKVLAEKMHTASECAEKLSEWVKVHDSRKYPQPQYELVKKLAGTPSGASNLRVNK